MQSISIPYGRGFQTAELQKTRIRGVLTAGQHATAVPDEGALVRRALEAPIGTERLCALARDKECILVITSDHTRPVPSSITLPILLEEIRRGAPNAQIKILIATGAHRPTTPEEFREKLGEEIFGRETIVVHRAERSEDMAFFGRLPSGGELWLNRLVKWADLVVSEGFIEPHFFAGFSGGRKSILPGIAARSTILYNHNARFVADPNATQGVLAGNPIHLDMCFAARQAGLGFILNVLLDRDKHIVDAFAGEAELAHRAGCARCAELARVEPVPADIVITSNGGYPLDQNLYQSVKAMTAAEACVRQGGVMILCAEAADGHGGEAFYRWLAERESPQAVLRDIGDVPTEQTAMDQWQAQILARVLCRAQCVFVTRAENRRFVEAMHMRWAATLADAIAQADRLLGPDAGVTVIPDGVGVIVRA